MAVEVVPNKVTKFAGQYAGITWDRIRRFDIPEAFCDSDDMRENSHQAIVFAATANKKVSPEYILDKLRRNVVGFDDPLYECNELGVPKNIGAYPYIHETEDHLPLPLPYTGPGYTIRYDGKTNVFRVYSDLPAEETLKNMAQMYAQWGPRHKDILMGEEFLDPNSKYWTRLTLHQVYPHIPEE